MNAQLTLDLQLKDGSSFGNFLPAQNREAMDRLRAAVEAAGRDEAGGERMFFLWGGPGTGKSHLLQAVCRQAQENGMAPVYVPLTNSAEFSTAILEGVEHLPLVCLDDVDHIAGNIVWEPAVFSLCERQREAHGTVIASGTTNPKHLGLRMPELATRLGWGPVYQLHALNDAEKLEAIRLRARSRGLEITEEVSRYILGRYPRDLRSLFDLLERIDQVSLASQRRITIPFIRSLG